MRQFGPGIDQTSFTSTDREAPANRGQRSRTTIGLWGHNGTLNLGNEATLTAIMQGLRRLDPAIEFRGFSWNPDDTRERHGIPSTSILRRRPTGGRNGVGAGGRSEEEPSSWRDWLGRYPRFYQLLRRAVSPLTELRFMVRALSHVKRIDLMLAAGTGQICETFGGAGGYPYSLWKWSLLCRLGGAKWAIVSAGAGPFRTALGRWLIRRGLARATYRSFRDVASKALVDQLEGHTRENRVFPDLVFGLDLSALGISLPAVRRRRIALTALPYRRPEHWEQPDDAKYQSYLAAVAGFTCSLVDRGYSIRLVPTDNPMDALFNDELMAKLESLCPAALSQVSAGHDFSFEAVMSSYSEAEIVVSARFHGVVFAYLLNKPVLGISVHPKISELMKDVGHSRFCADAETLATSDLIRQFDELERDREACSNEIRYKVAAFRKQLDVQYRLLLEL